MANVYTRTYAYTGQSNTKGSGSFSLSDSNVQITGDTTHAINQVVSVRLSHAHSSEGRCTWDLSARLVLSNGSSYRSDVVSHAFNKDVYRYNNTWTSIPSSLDFSYVTHVVVDATSPDKDSEDILYWRATNKSPMRLTVEFYDTPPVVYDPKITKFDAWRIDDDGAKSDSGTTIRATIRLSLASTASASVSTLKLYYSTGTTTTSSSSITFSASQISGMLSADYSLTIYGSYASGSDWNLLLRYTCGDEESIATVTVPRAFATMHLSPWSTGGVSIGGFSNSTEGRPMFEVHHPAYLYGGIAKVGKDSALTGLGIQSGKTERQTVPDYDVTLVSVTFEKAYAAAPIVIAGLESTSTNDLMGRCSCAVDNITATGFDLHFYNNGEDERGMYGAWCAIGTLA